MNKVADRNAWFRLGFGLLLGVGFVAAQPAESSTEIFADGFETGDLSRWSEVIGEAEVMCGDGICHGGENALTCVEDCPPLCGDGICNPGEIDSCPGDCVNPEGCGDGECTLDEDELRCPADCAPGCGNGECEAFSENCLLCPADCCPGLDLTSQCGDGVCEPVGDPPEDMSNCPQDCGRPATEPVPPPPLPPVCGDGACELGESPCECEIDCGPVGDPTFCACGDGTCDAEAGENCVTCAEDCGGCLSPPGGLCGDGVCEPTLGEACFNCVEDCGECPVFDSVDEPYVPPSDPAEQFDGLDPRFQVHWRLDLSEEAYPAPVEGDPSLETCTPLADAEGRRDVEIRPVGASSGQILNQPGTWNFWAVGARGTNGLTVVCWNRFVGATSDATVGAMPDPRNGVGLFCAVDSGLGFESEVEVEAGMPPVWIQAMELNGSGEPVVRYAFDQFGTFLNSGKPGDVEAEVTFHSSP